MDISIQSGSGGSIQVAGDLTFATVMSGLRQLQALSDQDSGGAVDLSGLQRADSAGLALLLEWMRRQRGRVPAVHFLNVPAHLVAIAKISGLEHILPLKAPR